MTKGVGRQRKRNRQREWDEDQDADAASREPRRFRGRESGVQEPSNTVKTLPACFTECETNGLVISPYGVLAFVRHEDTERLCRVAEELTDGRSSVLAPGDHVVVEKAGAEWLVRSAQTRKNRLSRLSIGGVKEQVFAANVDLLVIVTSARQPTPKMGVLDRYIIAAQVGGVDACICMNKMDLVAAIPEEVSAYAHLGVPVFPTSCERGEGVEELEAFLRGKLTIFAGQSGVGKSSLINTLDPSAAVSTADVSLSTDKGKHTTTASRLYRLRDGIQIIDTPGVKQLGLWGVSAAEVDLYFPDIAALAPNCHFRDCKHTHEPKCAVREALLEGRLAELRYQSYLRIRASLGGK